MKTSTGITNDEGETTFDEDGSSSLAVMILIAAFLSMLWILRP